MKIGIEGDNNALLPAGELQYLHVGCRGSVNLANVYRINAKSTEQLCRRTGQPLIKQ